MLLIRNRLKRRTRDPSDKERQSFQRTPPYAEGVRECQPRVSYPGEESLSSLSITLKEFAVGETVLQHFVLGSVLLSIPG